MRAQILAELKAEQEKALAETNKEEPKVEESTEDNKTPEESKEE